MVKHAWRWRWCGTTTWILFAATVPPDLVVLSHDPDLLWRRALGLTVEYEQASSTKRVGEPNLRVNETAGILETRRDGSGLWQPRLVPELPGKPGEYSPSGKSVHLWEVKIESNPDQNARKPGERDSVQEDHETVQDTTPKESLEGEQPLREKVQNKVSEIGDKVRARIAAIDDRAREISDWVRDQASEIGSKLTVGIATVSVAANLAGWTAIDLQLRESTTSITPIAQVEKTDPPASSEIPQVPVIKNPDIPLSRDEPKKGPERPDDIDSGLIEALEEDLEHESKHKKKGK